MPSGVLIIDKEAGPTSHDIVAYVRRLLGEKRVGHAGTLDPFASGVLVVLVGRGTALSPYLAIDDKEYVARASWGVETDTLDRTGTTVETTEAPLPNETEIASALAGFVGEIVQVPPVFSAKKIGGQPSHRLVRRGRAVEPAATLVRVHEMTLLGRDESGFTFRVHCGKGTYIRSLARDIGRALGGFAHLDSLRRTRSGRFGLTDAVPLSDPRKMDAVQREDAARRLVARLISLADAVVDHPSIALSRAQVIDAVHGRIPAFDAPEPRAGEGARAYRWLDEDGRLIAMADFDAAKSAWSIRRVFLDASDPSNYSFE